MNSRYGDGGGRANQFGRQIFRVRQTPRLRSGIGADPMDWSKSVARVETVPDERHNFCIREREVIPEFFLSMETECSVTSGVEHGGKLT